jgi:hypothetical protein
MKVVDLNLAPSYIPKWGAWETFRELKANHVDAGGGEIVWQDDEVRMYGREHPPFSALVVLGASSKSADGATIGQFGEGLKLAALVATRNKWKLSLHAEWGMVTFGLRKSRQSGVETLHAFVDTTAAVEGRFFVSLEAPDLASVVAGKMLPDDAPVAITKPEASPIRIYHRGMFLCQLDDESLMDWNLHHVEVNRDRSIPDPSSIGYRVGCEVRTHIRRNKQFAVELLKNQNVYEAHALDRTYLDDTAKGIMMEAFVSVYGAKAVLSGENPQINAAALRRGYIPVTLPQHLRNNIPAKSAEDVITLSDKLTQVKLEKTENDSLSELFWLVERLDLPVTVLVYEDDGQTQGVARWNGDTAEVWLNEKLFTPGHRSKRIETFCHELGHIKSRSGDATEAFEWGLDNIAGRLAVILLNKEG